MRERQAARSLSAHAIAGTHVVLLGLDVEERARPGLLGFAIHRTDVETGEAGYLPNFLRLPVNDRDGGPTSSRANPIQAFVWGDYSLHPGRRVRYRIEALYGEQANLEVGEAVELEVGTHDPWLGRHGVWFNRGAAGSQRFVDLFGDIDPRSSPKALAWLSRGLAEALVRFVERAMLLISGDMRVADVYLTEFMRTFTHLRFRASLDLDEDQRGPDPRAGRATAKLLLRPDDSWSEEYFADGPKRRERLLFR